MNTIKNTIKSQPFDGLKVDKLVKNDRFEIISVSLEKDALFPEHTSPSNALLIVLVGDIVFHIQGEPYHLTAQQYFSFPKEVPHWVKANENSKFLIIR